MNTVISLCDKTGNMVRPWAEAGYECWCVDIQHSIRRDREVRVGAGVIRYVWGDARSWHPPDDVIIRLAMFFAFPPCTELTCTGARDFQKKRGWMLADGIQLFDSCMMAAVFSGVPFMLENPATSRLNTHRRKPDYKFHPWEYAGYLDDIQVDNTSKNTGLWVGNGFVMPEKLPAPEPHRQDCWMASPGDDRADERSVTPMGFARAVFLANAPCQKAVAA
jgi:hypothetical protein